MSALDRILSTPLRAERSNIRVAADGYHLGAVQPGMNDREGYARLFAAAPVLLEAAREGLAFIEEWMELRSYPERAAPPSRKPKDKQQ